MAGGPSEAPLPSHRQGEGGGEPVACTHWGSGSFDSDSVRRYTRASQPNPAAGGWGHASHTNRLQRAAVGIPERADSGAFRPSKSMYCDHMCACVLVSVHRVSLSFTFMMAQPPGEGVRLLSHLRAGLARTGP